MSDNDDVNIIGAGLVSVDILHAVGDYWQPTEEVPVYTSGGTVCNVLCHLARTGWRCTLLGALGDDCLADVVRADLTCFGVNTDSLITRRGSLTRRIAHLVCTAGADAGLHRFALECVSCRKEFPHLRPPDMAEMSDAAHRAISRRTVLLIDRANELTLELATKVSIAGGVVVFEPGYLPSRLAEGSPGMLERVMQHVEILKYSQDLRYGGRAFRDARPQAAPKLKMVIETRGDRGIRFLRGNMEIRLTTTPIMKVVDTAGAGDAFMAGFLQGLGPKGIFALESLSTDFIESALHRAQAFGGLASMFMGAKGILYSRTEMEIYRAISRTMKRQRPPRHFGSGAMPPGIGTSQEATGGGGCPVCRIGDRQPR